MRPWVLVSVLFWIGIPLNEAKPTGLFMNTISLAGASIDNIRNERLDLRLGIPIIVSSIVVAPLGAYATLFIPQRVVLVVFVLFLFFAGTMMLFFRASRYGDRGREDRPVLPMVGIGAAAGFLSGLLGLLGIGGGGLLSPLLVMMGFNPKKVAAITAFVVPFSFLTGFIAYWAMGPFNPALVLPVGTAAYLGGWLGTRFMQLKLSPSTGKRILGVLILLLAAKLAVKLISRRPVHPPHHPSRVTKAVDSGGWLEARDRSMRFLGSLSIAVLPHPDRAWRDLPRESGLLCSIQDRAMARKIPPLCAPSGRFGRDDGAGLARYQVSSPREAERPRRMAS